MVGAMPFGLTSCNVIMSECIDWKVAKLMFLLDPEDQFASGVTNACPMHACCYSR
jgi:hypothetical protein